MSTLRNVVTARNVLICAGIYYSSGWLTFLFAIGYDKLTQGIIYRGDFAADVVLPLVEHFPRALFSAAAGVAVVYFVESNQEISWALFPAAMYATFGFLGYHWARPPMVTDRVGQTIGALFPAVTCI